MCHVSTSGLPLLDDLAESISNRTPRTSFLNLPSNRRRLEACTQAFIQRVYPGKADDSWTRRRASAYLVACYEFQRTLLLIVYTTSGQPPRGPEILSIKVCNTESTPRNIFISHGRLCLVTQYNKSRPD